MTKNVGMLNVLLNFELYSIVLVKLLTFRRATTRSPSFGCHVVSKALKDLVFSGFLSIAVICCYEFMIRQCGII